MKIIIGFLTLIVFGVSSAVEKGFEESQDDMLIQCNMHQTEIFAANRTVHECENNNYNEHYSFIITDMVTHYSKQKFLCFLFIKSETFKLKFKFWFSHKNYKVNAVSEF